MPISKYNPDGTVDIYNRKTGKTMSGVKPEELGNISPNLVAEYAQNQTPEALLKRKSAEQELATLGQPELSAAEEKRQVNKGDADRVLKQLEELYFQGDSSGDDLSKGRIGGVLSFLTAAAGINQPAKTYGDARKSSGAQLARALGDVGNLNEKEQAAAIGLLPTLFSTPEEAAAGFNAIREKLGVTPGDNVAPSGQQRFVENPVINALAKFGANAQRDTDEIVKGVGQLPQAFAEAGDKGPMGSLDLLKNMGLGAIKSYIELAKNPVGTLTNKPVSTFLNVLPAVSKVKGVNGATTAKPGAITTIADDTARITDTVAEMGDVAPTVTRPNIITKIKEGTKMKAAEDLLNTSSGAMNKAFDARIDPRKVIIDYKLTGSHDDLLGPISEGGYGGKVGGQIAEAESQIQAVLSKTNDTISWQPVIDELKLTRDKLAKGNLKGNAEKVAALDEEIKYYEAQPDIKSSDALDVVRAANETFGDSIVKETKGAISTQVNKIIANTLRNTLKSKYKDIAESLRKQQELIITREILKDARGASSRGGLSGMTRLDITRPLKVLEPIFKNPNIASKIAGGGGGGSF